MEIAAYLIVFLGSSVGDYPDIMHETISHKVITTQCYSQ